MESFILPMVVTENTPISMRLMWASVHVNNVTNVCNLLPTTMDIWNVDVCNTRESHWCTIFMRGTEQEVGLIESYLDFKFEMELENDRPQWKATNMSGVRLLIFKF